MNIKQLPLILLATASLFAFNALAGDDQDPKSKEINLPDQFTATGYLIQQNNNQGGCNAQSIDGDLNNCTVDGMIKYDFRNGKMYTEYTPCLPLLTPFNGSDETCSYTFLNRTNDTGNALGDIYYVYTNQRMTAESTPDEPQCCVIKNFSMLSPSFPSFLHEYSQGCPTGNIRSNINEAQEITLLSTPGDPGGFYGYYSGTDKLAPSKIHGHFKPWGFGGKTPTTYSQMVFRHYEAGQPNIKTPSQCKISAPDCMAACAPDPNDPTKNICGEETLSELLMDLTFPHGTGGCNICHTPLTKAPTPFSIANSEDPEGWWPECPNTATN